MNESSLAQRVAACVTYTLAIFGAGSVFWDMWEFVMIPSLRTIILLLLQGAALVISVRQSAFLRTHASRAFRAQALTLLMWTIPWAIFLLERAGYLQTAWRRANGPYFVMLVSMSVIVGMVVMTYCVEAIQDALEGRVKESIVRSARPRG